MYESVLFPNAVAGEILSHKTDLNFKRCLTQEIITFPQQLWFSPRGEQHTADCKTPGTFTPNKKKQAMFPLLVAGDGNTYRTF